MTARLVLGLLAAALVLPQAATAHGLGVDLNLAVPAYLFAWAAAIVLIASFAALSALWPRPRFAEIGQRVLARTEFAGASFAVFAGAIGLALFLLVVHAGLSGEQADLRRNFAPNFIYLAFWVGVPLLSALLGDVFKPFNPWRATARMISWSLRRLGVRWTPRPYPERWGCWPAVIGLLCFVWLELVGADAADPSTLAWLSIIYALVQLAGSAWFGTDRWDRSGDAFAVYFRLFARISPLAWEGRRLSLRAPFVGLSRTEMSPGLVALLVVAIGSTSYDGLSRGTLWREAAGQLEVWLAGLGAEAARYLTGTFGLALMIGLVAGIYAFGVAGMLRIGTRHRRQDLSRSFAHSLVPIALAYLVAHYFTFVMTQGQAFGFLLSDPLGDGSDLFGTAHWSVDFSLLSAGVIWTVQLAALIGGHVTALVLAHERSLLTFRRPHDATRSQYWSLSVMVGFTCLGLWLLESAS